MKRIGLFGGSFDPVHVGHLLVAQAASEELELDRLFFIPTSQSPFKPAHAPSPAPLRLQLLRLALAGQSRYEIDDQEIRRGGLSYSIETVRRYAERYPEARRFYLLGADHLAQLPRWREADALAELVEFVVVPRPSETVAAPPSPFRVHTLSGFPVAISSSQIRARVGAGLPVGALLLPAVAEAIRNNRLYLQ